AEVGVGVGRVDRRGLACGRVVGEEAVVVLEAREHADLQGHGKSFRAEALSGGRDLRLALLGEWSRERALAERSPTGSSSSRSPLTQCTAAYRRHKRSPPTGIRASTIPLHRPRRCAYQ